LGKSTPVFNYGIVEDKLDEVEHTTEFSKWEEAFYQALPHDEEGVVDKTAIVKWISGAINNITTPGFKLTNDTQTISFLLAFIRKLWSERKGNSLVYQIAMQGFLTSKLGSELVAQIMSATM
jgi:hypothetical protein